MARKAILSIPELSADLQRFLEDLQKETDRGVALVGAAFINNVLESMLITYLVDDKKVVKQLLNPDNILGSLSARTKMAYCLGLIGKENYSDLNLIRKIRNEFAHLDKHITFNMPKIKNLCQILIIPKVIPLPGKIYNRDLFILAVVVISNQLLLGGLTLKHKPVGKDFKLAELVKV